jgi:hypothetical protein
VRRVPFSCFVRSDSFSAIPRAMGAFFIFCAPGVVSRGSRFHEGVGSRFQVLRSRTHFRMYRGHRGPFSCFTLLNSFPTILRALGPVFKFCSPGLVFGENEGVRSHFHVLRSRSRFPRYRGHRVPFSSFALPDSFLLVSRALGPVLSARTRFWRYRRRRLPC